MKKPLSTGIWILLLEYCWVGSYAAETRWRKTSSVNYGDPPAVCGYDSCPAGKDGMINVHIVAHTHNDVGWLKTVDQYYYGARNDIQIAGVQYILDSVVDALMDDPSRKFIYVETAFFWRWWLQQDDQMHHTVHRLVKEGRLEFISGGWSMNDEADTHYSSIIENFAWGLRKLNDTFGECGRPKVGWQIDPFGHSREQAALFAMLGFDGAFLGRIDQQDKDTRVRDKTMEMVWKGSDSLGEAADLFTGILPNVYWPPSTFCFDLLCQEQPIMDDPTLSDYNVDERVNTFIEVVQNQTKQYATSNLIITMGNDFNYQNANVWFKNLDKLMKYVNARQANGSNINLFYSTPSCYLKALHQANTSWPVKDDDFFPYGSGAHTYWTGYFTSRPAFKRFEREASSFLQQCKQIDALARLGPEDQHDVSQLREAIGVSQHHDAITGTERQHVADDYAKKLDQGRQECQEVVADGVNKLSNVSITVKYEFCNLLNISQCHITENLGQTAIVLWNPLPRTVNHYVRLPVMDGDFTVTGSGRTEIPLQLTPLPKHVLAVPGRVSAATHELTFRVKLPPVGFATYIVKKAPKSKCRKGNRARLLQRRTHSNAIGDDEFVVQNEFLSLSFDQATGTLKSLTNLETKDTITINQTFGYYVGSIGNNSMEELRATGAYISRPNCTGGCWKELKGNGSYEIMKGTLGQEVRQYINPWISQVVRLHTTSKHINFEWQVGPIPIGDGVGKEIISRFSTSMKTGDQFWTDSNGRQNIKRVRNFRSSFKLNLTEPISSNYYPVVDRIFARDDVQKTQLTILTDRAQGGASLNEGQLELMIHRRLLVDDWLGVSEPLNETGLGEGLVVRGTHRLIFTKTDKSAGRHRLLSHGTYWQPSLLFTPEGTGQSTLDALQHSTYTGVVNALPDSVNIVSIEQWKGTSLIVRLEHMFEIGEDPLLSQPATVDVKEVLKDFDIVSIREMTLDGNVALQDVKRLQWKKRGSNIPDKGLKRKPFVDAVNTTVTLSPMEIRTFQVEIRH